VKGRFTYLQLTTKLENAPHASTKHWRGMASHARFTNLNFPQKPQVGEE
jgi:hypothetical protein